ncbi:tRNA uridine(34) 5-carboxymethylaminomethyl modification radical SAM/GNAT enzyme Elp3 [Candidatus Dojkabacteria bacterium]|nr:tRNA uridine(34) 5-carboxymethylaminomethyl modification radical SAM/GNAT enzyme Elp3 [Candidatus Dojkabacteria bacterium]
MNNIEKIIVELSKLKRMSYKKFRKILSKYPCEGTRIYSKSEILGGYNELIRQGKIKRNIGIEGFLQTKPTRTISGVAPVTVLTKPYKCPRKCIFCPTREDQPKSYLSSEPGAMRAKMLEFDPYRQVSIRIKALENIGHNTDKVELIILGGTWSSYPEKYQVWFVKECFRAMNEQDNKSHTNDQIDQLNDLGLQVLRKELLIEQKRNETAKHRCVGLVIETRPDCVDDEEVKFLRFLGVTKVQIGVQTLDDKILKLNQRGHTVKDIKKAITLLRLAGFKLHLHWMLNLYGSNSQKDYRDFKRLFDDPGIRPDELKIYPCVLIKGTELYELYKKGKYKPYTKDELLDLLVKCKQYIPRYTRISRLFRDIPSFEIIGSVKETNFREIVLNEMKNRGLRCNCIRCREVRELKIKNKKLKIEKIHYRTNVSDEFFISFISPDDKIVGFLRLSLPYRKYAEANSIQEIQNSAMIREVHVYGASQKLNISSKKASQHKGIGVKLIKKAEEIAKSRGFNKISVISAVGTREYYKRRGYRMGELYMSKDLK